jgi:hypothetical protein
MAEFNPMAFFLMGQQAKLHEEDLKVKQIERRRMQALPGARRDYFAGDGSQLQALEPNEWSLLEGQKAQREAVQQKASFEAVERSRQEMLFRARVVSSAVGRAAQDPREWPGAVRMLESVGAVQPGQLPAERPPMESLVSMLNQHRTLIGTLSDPKVTNLMTEILAKNNYSGREGEGLQDPVVQQQLDEAMKSRETAAKRPLANVVVNNASPLTTGNLAKQQMKVAEADEKLWMLDQMEKDIENAGGHEEISSIVKQAGADILGWKSRVFTGSLTPDQEERLGRRARAVSTLSTFMNAVFRDISGAAIMEHEMERLMKSVPTPSDPSFVRKAKMAAWRRNFEIIREAGFSSIKEGIKAKHSELSLDVPSSREKKTETTKDRGLIITNGQEEGYLDPGQPMPEGWKAR